MATLGDDFKFNGPVGGYTFYRKKGSDKVFVRARHQGGRKKKKKDLAPRVQETVSEFSLRSSAVKAIRLAIKDIKHLSDHNFTPKLNGVARKPQLLDPAGARGERSLLISRHTSYFAGFNLNKNNIFDSIIRHPLHYSIDPVSGIANVQLPPLLPGISLFLPWPVPRYRVIIGLGLVADQLFETQKKDEWLNPGTAVATTDWLLSTETYDGKSFKLVLPVPEKKPAVAGLSYVLSIGIEWEITILNARAKKEGGAAKIVDLVAVQSH